MDVILIPGDMFDLALSTLGKTPSTQSPGVMLCLTEFARFQLFPVCEYFLNISAFSLESQYNKVKLCKRRPLVII